MKRRIVLGSAVSLALSVLVGIVTYQLSDIPFGPAFSTAFTLTFIFLSLALAGLAIILYRSRRTWAQWISIIPGASSLAILVLQISVQADPRVIHFRGIPPSPSTQEWQEDVRFLVEEMEHKHPGLFARLDRTVWDSVTSDIVTRVPSLSEGEIIMELTRIAGLPKDGHTFPFIMLPSFAIHSYPFVLFGFPEGWHVVKAGRGLEDLIGARLLSVEGHTVQDIYDTYPQLIPWENEQSRREHFTYMVNMAEWLAYHGLIDDVGDASFTFVTTQGDTLERSLSPVNFWPHFLWTGTFPIPNDEPPVFTNPRADAYTYRTMHGGKVLYIQFNQCINQPGRETAQEFAHRVGEYLDAHPVERCIIDLRNNDGGQRVYTDLIRVIRGHPSIDRRGNLFVLIGRRTFSAAVMFSAELQLQTQALFVGEPTGQGTIFYSRPRLSKLPHSGLPFAISSYRNVAGLPFDNRKAIRPDIPVPYGLDDFLARRDPVLEAALAYREPIPVRESSASDRLGRAAGRYQKDETLLLYVEDSEEGARCTVTDALPNTSLLFTSVLRGNANGSYDTRIPGVSLEFAANRTGAPSRATLDWMGEEVRFERAEGSFQIPFERFTAGAIADACTMLRSNPDHYRSIYPSLEALLNQLGYQYLRASDTSAALQVFYLNVELYPLSWNVYDSYGEALMVNGQIDSSIANYTRSLELNPDNTNAAQVIERLRGLR